MPSFLIRYASYVGFAFEALALHVGRKVRVYTALAIAVFVVIPLWILFMPAFGFPKGALIEVGEDAAFRDTAAMLENQHIVSSSLLFKALARLSGADKDMKAGRYVFMRPEGIAVVLWRLSHGISGIEAIRVTFPEGTTAKDMSEVLAASLPGFDAAEFRAEAKPYEGYLFPDTYDLYADAAPGTVIERMRDQFAIVMDGLQKESTSTEPLERVVSMASILEKETKPGEDRAIVSGILWHRIDIGMALQVDAVFGYIHGTDTYHPDLDDLEVDSPYNTYKYPDLPPGPIGNPGEDALYAALHPVSSPYLYYLTGKDGTVHYAKTFEEHKANKEKYLR